MLRDVGERELRCRGVRQDAEAGEHEKEIQDAGDREPAQDAHRKVAARIAHFARHDGGDVETDAGEQGEVHRVQEPIGLAWLGRRDVVPACVPQPRDRNQAERHHFRDCEQVAGPGASRNPADVDRGQNDGEHGDRRGARQGWRKRGPDLGCIVEHHLRDQRVGSNPRDREQPADGEARSRPKDPLRVHLRAARDVIATRNLRERQREERDDDECDKDDGEAVTAGVDRQSGRHREDARADDRIDAERDDVESPEPAMEPGRFDRTA